MGSDKYPDENDYDAFLTAHGGASNACTEEVRLRLRLGRCGCGCGCGWGATGRAASVGVMRWGWRRGRADRSLRSLAPSSCCPQECTTFHFGA